LRALPGYNPRLIAMRLLFLSSAWPCSKTGMAVNVAFGALLQSAAALGHAVQWAYAGSDTTRDVAFEAALEGMGVKFAGDFSAEMESPQQPRPWRTIKTLRKAACSRPDDDLPRFRDPGVTVRVLSAGQPDAIILFWDTWFDHLLPALRGHATIVYGARPRHASAMARLENGMRSPGALGLVRDSITMRLLKRQEQRHYRRLTLATGLTNICAVDTAIYRNQGLACAYVPNTWPDAFGAEWEDRRDSARSAEGAVRILGNISAVTATGNLFGMRYLARELLPRFDRELAGVDWTVAITGGGRLADDLARAFDRPRVRVKGFVPDLDAEILGNDIFLLSNNAGPYTGGYTRVVYAMSSGACLIAHRRLADSMPEVRDDENALLGDSADEIAGCVARAVHDPALRKRLGRAARRTYEGEYAPRIVTERLLSLASLAHAA
jgi:hypothetical protein